MRWMMIYVYLVGKTWKTRMYKLEVQVECGICGWEEEEDRKEETCVR